MHPVFVGSVELHESHVLSRFRGIVFCHRCGRAAVREPVLLGGECRGYRAHAGKYVIKRLMENPPRLPQGIFEWPEDEDTSPNAGLRNHVIRMGGEEAYIRYMQGEAGEDESEGDGDQAFRVPAAPERPLYDHLDDPNATPIFPSDSD